MAAISLGAAAAADAAELTLADVEDLALRAQPQLEILDALTRAARQRAIAAGRLADPMLTAGITNLPANTPDRFSLSRDFMTMTQLGLMQEFTPRSKRRLRSQAEILSAEQHEAEREVAERTIRRDVALAFLDVWHSERAAELVGRMIAEARRERAVAVIAFEAGRAPRADVLATEVELELLQDRLDRHTARPGDRSGAAGTAVSSRRGDAEGGCRAASAAAGS